MTTPSRDLDMALVTGAARGLGAVIARTLHRHGYRVVLADLESDQVAAIARELDPSGRTAMSLVLDVREKRDFESALDALADWGGVNVLVNNAALSFTTPAFEISAEEFDAVMAVNLRGPFFASQVIGAQMIERRYGRIVNIASQAGQMGGTVTGGHYAASKGGIIAMTKHFARAFAGTGITVNSVSPGPLDLPTVRAVIGDKIDAVTSSIPAGRLGYPEEVAEVVALLASREMGYVTGATWDINGGSHMR